MTVEDLQDVTASVKALPVAALVSDLITHEVVAANEKAAELFGTSVDDLVGRDAISHIRPDEQDSARQAYAAMAAKAVDGYHAVRHVVTPNGDTKTLQVWGRRVDGANRAYGTWFLTSASQPPMADIELPVGESDVVLALTDHDWQIQYMSADASLLGVEGSELRGYPLVGLIHSSAILDFVRAADRAATGSVSVSVSTRIRVGKSDWADLRCLLARMCEHRPPRLGVVISRCPTPEDDAAEELEGQVRHFALEAKGFQALDTLPALVGLPTGNELSARQTEIVARLAAGEGVPEIARAMFLSPSTVRNHLAAIYKKFGVHSQAELLAALLRAATSREEW